MLEASIRLATDQDGAHLLKAVTDEQDYERALHDTRRPGVEIADSYLAYIGAKIAQNRGALLIAELNGVFHATPHVGSSTMATSRRLTTRTTLATLPTPMSFRSSEGAVS
jgi:hypothetical protein